MGVNIPLRNLAIRLAAAWAVVVCAMRGDASLGAEPAGSPPAQELQLAMPLSKYQPANLPAVNGSGRELTDEPTPPPAVPTEPDKVEYLAPQAPFDIYETPADDVPFGQYPDNWMWGAGGSPYRTGPGWLDDWKVGPIWDVSVDGMTLFREEADLGDLEDAARADEEDLMLGEPLQTQFGYGGGGRLWVMGNLPRTEKYQIQFGYEGIEEWNAALLFPEDTVGVDTDGMAGDEYEYDAIRSLHYRSSMHSAELNFYRRAVQTFRPFWGIRYVRFNDEITDTTNQEAPFPPPVNMPDPVVDAVTIEDSIDFIDIKNNLVGFQLGLREDLWHLNRRVTVQGFVNAGVYYNRIQFADGSYDTTTTFLPDDGMTADANEAQTLTSSTGEVSSSEPSDVAYLAEASITAICRLNKCVALRGGYQVFWVDGLALAEDAYLGDPLGRHDFLMQGWHAGVEYRR